MLHYYRVQVKYSNIQIFEYFFIFHAKKHTNAIQRCLHCNIDYQIFLVIPEHAFFHFLYFRLPNYQSSISKTHPQIIMNIVLVLRRFHITFH